MAIRDRMSGNEAIATAMRQINPDVMGAFPITPSTEIPQYFSSYFTGLFLLFFSEGLRSSSRLGDFLPDFVIHPLPRLFLCA